MLRDFHCITSKIRKKTSFLGVFMNLVKWVDRSTVACETWSKLVCWLQNKQKPK